MKLLIPAFIMMLFVLALTSCEKRDYTCRCIAVGRPNIDETLGRMSNDKAQKACNDKQLGLGMSYKCKVMY